MALFKRMIRIIAAVSMIILTSPMLANAAIPTGSTEFLPTSPLILSAYKTKSLATDIEFVELYNTSSSLVRLQDWQVQDVANNRLLQFDTSYLGYMEPGTHVIVARDGVVGGTPSFRITGWSGTAAPGTKISVLRLIHEGYRSLDANLSSKTIDLDMPMIRTYNSTSYSTAASPFESAYRILFDDGLYSAPSAPSLRIVEVYPYASDCAPNDLSVLCGDYIKLQNTSSNDISLDGLTVRTTSSSSSSTSSNTFTLTGNLAAGGYKTVWLTDDGQRLSLTNSGGYIWIEDSWHLVQYGDTMTKYDSAATAEQGFSYALDDTNSWVWTSTPTPGQANEITPEVVEVAECPEGKYRNPDTNRCRNIEEVLNSLSACDEGYERNLVTNRCRKIGSDTTGSVLTPCKEGQIRNPDTNRCRSIASEVADLIPCNDGYERNPDTNRCRKVSGGEVKGAQYPVAPITKTAGNTAGLWTIGGIIAIAGAYGIWEWRHEITSRWMRIVRWRK